MRCAQGGSGSVKILLVHNFYRQHGGETAVALGHGYEACNAQHDHTEFSEDSEFYMTFLGPLNFIDDDGNTIALVGAQQVLDAWIASA